MEHEAELLIQKKTPEERQEDGTNAGAIAGGLIAAPVAAAVYFTQKTEPLQFACGPSTSSSSSRGPDGNDPGEEVSTWP
jgi:hypothetical protein